jgi:hypothetical protein
LIIPDDPSVQVLAVKSQRRGVAAMVGAIGSLRDAWPAAEHRAM